PERDSGDPLGRSPPLHDDLDVVEKALRPPRRNRGVESCLERGRTQESPLPARLAGFAFAAEKELRGRPLHLLRESAVAVAYAEGVVSPGDAVAHRVTLA